MLWSNKKAFRCLDNEEVSLMKNIFTKNDKSTYKDELCLGLITVVALAIGILLIVFRPSFWIISESTSVCTGVLFLLIAVMYFPCIIYRLFDNKIEKKDVHNNAETSDNSIK